MRIFFCAIAKTGLGGCGGCGEGRLDGPKFSPALPESLPERVGGREQVLIAQVEATLLQMRGCGSPSPSRLYVSLKASISVPL